MKVITRLFSFFAISLMVLPAQAVTYAVDKDHTHVGFEIKHLVVSKVQGRFNDFNGTFDFDEKDHKLSNVIFTVKTASLDTNQKDRDDHLRSPDFLDVAKFPEMTFKSTEVKYKGKKPKSVTGDLTIRGVTKKTTFDLDFEGMTKDLKGNQILVWEAETEIDRKDFGVNWNKKLDSGGWVVGDKLKIELQGEAKHAATPAAETTPATK